MLNLAFLYFLLSVCSGITNQAAQFRSERMYDFDKTKRSNAIELRFLNAIN